MLILHFALSLVLKAKTWMDELDGLIEEKFAEWTACRTSKRKFVRLFGPEDLEARVTPANVDLWVGNAGAMFNLAQNWSINGAAGVPQNGDTLQFGGSVGAVAGKNTSAVDNMQGLQPASVNITGTYNQTITLDFALTVNGSVSIASTTSPTITGSTLSIQPGAGNVPPTFNWGAGTISSDVTFSAPTKGGTITINGSDVTLNGTLTNNGTLNWSSANPQHGPGPNINLGGFGTIQNDGTFNIQTASTESITGSGSIANNATMQKTGVNQTSIGVSFRNNPSGTLTLNSGTLAFQGLCTTSGKVVLNGGNISSKLSLTVAGGGNLSGVGTVTITGGASYVDNFGTVTPGVNNVPGTLTIVGTYEQEGTGTLSINIDASGNSGVLNVQGEAELAGTLSVAKNVDYQPPGGTQVTFLTYTSVSGDFSTKNITNDGWETTGGPVRFVPEELITSYILDAQNI